MKDRVRPSFSLNLQREAQGSTTGSVPFPELCPGPQASQTMSLTHI